MRRRQLAHRALAFGELLDDRAPNRVGEGREHVVEPDPLNLKHQLNRHATRILKRFLNNGEGPATSSSVSSGRPGPGLSEGRRCTARGQPLHEEDGEEGRYADPQHNPEDG